MVYYLGTHEPHWLSRGRIPLMVSRRRLARLRGRWPRARAAWALDSGAFTELERSGTWGTSARQYAAEAIRAAEEIGRLRWAAVRCAGDVASPGRDEKIPGGVLREETRDVR